MGSKASTASTSSPLAARSAALAKVRASGQSRCLCPTLLAGVDESDHFHIRIVEVGADVQVVDATESDEGGPDRPTVRTERPVVFHSVPHRNRFTHPTTNIE